MPHGIYYLLTYDVSLIFLLITTEKLTHHCFFTKFRWDFFQLCVCVSDEISDLCEWRLSLLRRGSG